MYLENIPNGYMERVLFWDNFATCYGGGLFISDCSDFTTVNTVFVNNCAYCSNSPVPHYKPETYGSGGMFIEQSKVVIHNMTATQNGTDTSDYLTKRRAYKAGCIARSDVWFYNSIIYPDTMNIEYNHQNTVYYDHCCLWTTQHLMLQGLVYDSFLNDCNWDANNTVIESNIFSSDPIFNLITYFPYPYLQSTSPCVNTGNTSYPIQYDIFWLPREVGGTIDMGAMEFQGQ